MMSLLIKQYLHSILDIQSVSTDEIAFFCTIFQKKNNK